VQTIPNFDLESVKKVLVTDDCHVLLREGLARKGYQVDFEPDISPSETLQRIGDYEGLIINSKIMVDLAFLERAARLRFVGRLGSGMEIVDRPRAAERGVAVFSSPEGNRNAVAEQAVAMLLALANNLLRADREVRQNIWEREKNRGFELEHKTLGIIGFGHTGSQFVHKLQGFDMQLMAFDKYLAPAYAQKYPTVRETDLREIQEKADIISLHLPLTPETKHLVDADFIRACKPGFILLNTSRGKCVNLPDLVAGLEDGRVGGACLDVFENEKPQTYTDAENELYSRLHRMENVVLAPHIAGWTHESKRKMAEVLLGKITAFLEK
jgi:D-3-phosphoglycerate dehydrogenase / 2-oxoglutarate reductase